MKKAVLILIYILSINIASSKCHAAADIAGAEYELEELGEYCDDQLESIEASGYNVSDTIYVSADGDSLPADSTGTIHVVHCGEDH